MSRSTVKSALVFLLVLAGAASAKAAVITSYASRAAYDAAFPGSVIENWDGVASGFAIPNGGTLNGITYNSSASIATTTNAFLVTTSPNGLGREQGQLDFFDATDSITFTFANPISSFGIDINTFSTVVGEYTTTTNLGDVIGSVFDPFPGFTTGQFIGFASNLAFNSVTFVGQGIAPNATYTLDTMRATAAPEPSTLGLIGLGLVGLGAMRRRGWYS